MTRFTDSLNQAGAESSHVVMGIMVDLDFGSGNLYLWDGAGQISWNGQTWYGVGSLGTIEAVAEGSDDRPKAIKMSLSGINTAIMTEAIAADFFGRDCKIYVAFFDTETNALLANPELEFEGRIDSVEVESAENASAVTLLVESRLVFWRKPNGELLTDEHQQGLFAGDLFFDQVCVQADQYLEWGALKINFGATPRDKRIDI